jgi:acetate kinase
LERLDALVFTGGIGEHAVAVREMVCVAAAWLGVELDPDANVRGGPRLTKPGSRASARFIPSNEELMIARHTCRLLAAARPGRSANQRDELEALPIEQPSVTEF